MSEVTQQELNIMKHAWGFNAREPGFRDYFVTGRHDKLMMGLVQRGYFKGPHGDTYGEDNGCFNLTEKGKEYMEKLKRNSFLDSITMSFPEEGLDFNATVKQFERAFVLKALDESNWVIAEAARKLRVERTFLAGKMDRLGIQRPKKRFDY